MALARASPILGRVASSDSDAVFKSIGSLAAALSADLRAALSADLSLAFAPALSLVEEVIDDDLPPVAGAVAGGRVLPVAGFDSSLACAKPDWAKPDIRKAKPAAASSDCRVLFIATSI